MFESGFRTKTSSKTIRESLLNPLKSIPTAIIASSIVRNSPLKSGGHWGMIGGILTSIRYVPVNSPL